MIRSGQISTRAKHNEWDDGCGYVCTCKGMGQRRRAIGVTVNMSEVIWK
jgi:hypothetical protein